MMKLKISIIIAVFTLFFFQNIYSANLINGNVFSFNNKPFSTFLVDKSAKKLFVAEVNDNIVTLVKNYNVLIGEKEGDKVRKGDKRTPEGIYFIQGFIPSSKLSHIYGDGAYILNYPNIVDRALKKTGHGIWIHGLDEKMKKTFTQGCVAMHNRAFDDLSKYIGESTPVVISNKLIFLNSSEYNKNKKKFLKFLNNFITTWEKGDFKKFKFFIHKKYLNNLKVGYGSFLKQKKLLFRKIKYRKILTDNIKIFRENDSELLFDFKQFYCATNISAYGEKKLYFFDNKLIAEEYLPKNKNIYVSKKINYFLNSWINAWESKNVELYKSFYSKRFKKFEMWIKNKKNKFKKYRTIKVLISNIKIREISPTKYIVSFKQLYKTESYKDVGIKKIILAGCPGDFKILSESWKALKSEINSRFKVIK